MLSLLFLWGAAWLFVGGTVQRAGIEMRQKAFEIAADAGFSVENILVEGRLHSDPDILKSIINVQRGDPIFAFDPRDAKEMIERISWVKEAHVERHLPDTIYIGLVERTPVALWQNRQKIRVIDSDGVTLSDRMLEPYRDFLIFVGENAPLHAAGLLGLLEAEPSVKDGVEAAVWIGDRRWDLKMKNGVTVMLPEDDPGFALRRLAQAQDKDGLLDRDLTAIDMREPDRMTLRTKPGAVQEYKASAKGSDI